MKVIHERRKKYILVCIITFDEIVLILKGRGN